MLFSRRLSLSSLIDLCRSMRFSLNSGLMLRDVMDLLANKGTRKVRPVAGKISKDLKAGWSLQDALKKQEHIFPPLFVALTSVGEESGNLPEVLHELEKYYVLQQKLRREFANKIAWPIVQFIAATVVVSILIFVLGVIPASGLTGEHLDPLGLGLVGPEGAAIFFFSVWGIVLGTVALFWGLKRALRRRAVIERFLLRLPGIGPCMRAIAMTRFCVAGRLMLETSLSIFKTLRLAFLATDNMAFISVFPQVETSLRQGNSITTSFERSGVFKERFLSAIAVAEESGRLPESLKYMAEEYQDETERRLGWLTRLASILVIVGVAAVLIVCIFQIFLNVYYKQLNEVINNPLKFRR